MSTSSKRFSIYFINGYKYMTFCELEPTLYNSK